MVSLFKLMTPVPTGAQRNIRVFNRIADAGQTKHVAKNIMTLSALGYSAVVGFARIMRLVRRSLRSNRKDFHAAHPPLDYSKARFANQ
jgi:hypothetical protein